MGDEEGHIDFLETQLGLFDRIGGAHYEHLNAEPANEADAGDGGMGKD
jgi:bacterioferritin